MRLLSIFVLLFLFLSPTFGQNWKTINTSDTTYFRGGLHRSDYFSNQYAGILKMIFTDSSSTSGSDSTFYFYNTIRETGIYQCLDTAAPTWLGSKFIRTSNGTEYFFNSVGDTITINTQAQQGSTWTIAKGNTNLTFEATVISTGLTTVEGAQDSFKRLSIQAYQNGNPVTDPYNGKILEWSKEHGWLTTLDLYRFPNQINGWDDFGALTESTQITRLDNNFAYLDMNYIDLLWKYAAGNEWIHHSEKGTEEYGGGMSMYPSPYDGAFETITHDSVLSSSLINANCIVVNFITKKYTVDGWHRPNFMYPLQWESVKSSTTIFHTDTIFSETPSMVINNSHPELFRPGLQMSNVNQETSLRTRYFSDTMCNRPTFTNYSVYQVYIDYVNNCWILGWSVSGGSTFTAQTLYGFGFLSGTYAFSGFALHHGTLDFYEKQYYSYLKLPGCTSGTKIEVLALDAQNIVQSKPSIDIYPNPASGEVILRSNYADLEAHVSLIDMTGKLLLQKHGLQLNNIIDTKGIASGIYMIHVATSNGTAVTKVTIQ